MPSILYSTTCVIKTDLYRLRIYVNNQNDDTELIFPKKIPIVADSLDSTPADIPINHIQPAYTRLEFELLSDKKSNNDIPKIITLNHLLNVEQDVLSPKKPKRNWSSGVPTPSLQISHREANELPTPSLDHAEELNSITLTPDIPSTNSPRQQSRFRHFLSSLSTPDHDPILLYKTAIKIKYADVSDSIRWSVKSLELEMDSEDLANSLYVHLKVCLSTLKQRPRRLLTFVNPLSGKGRARSIYDRKVLPLFEDINVTVDTIYTERANHAREHILNEMHDEYDGLICVGGDGMFAELCHGLLLRTANDAQIDMDNPKVNVIRPNLRIGIIPAGSTDAVVFGTTGLNDPVTSALQIIVGESLPIDISTVHNENGFVRFMATMLSYGFFGDIIEQSDKWRCLGPFRYDLAGFCQFLRSPSYHSELTITLSPHDSAEICHAQPAPSLNSVTTSFTSSIAPDCQKLIRNTSGDAIGKLVTPNIAFCSRNCGKCAMDEKLDLTKTHLPLQIKREGRYTTINCLNMPCRCAKSKYGMSPFVHLGDGTFDLILVKRSWRTGFFRFLWQVANDSRSIDSLPNVERYRVSEVLIHPINRNQKQGGHWACDGELISGSDIQIRIHRQTLNLFASGIQFEEPTQSASKKTRWFDCFQNKKGQISQESNSSS